ncbi:MAG: hypothetical protein SVR08_07150 [Spirochaetota bacterium]|nr:hypothetical protein [Spirochaetota bacterium]
MKGEIDNILKTLSPEEIEQHKALIEECKKREASIIENGQILREKIHRLSNISQKIIEDIKNIHQTTMELEELSHKMDRNIHSSPLEAISDEFFFHA